MPPTADNGASLLDAELVLPRLREADPDEDAVTLAAEAALPVLERATLRPDALVLATTEPPYDEGGNVQPLAELLGLAGPLVAFELTATDRDGLTALRLAAALVADGSSALVCASGRRGAVSLLLARPGRRRPRGTAGGPDRGAARSLAARRAPPSGARPTAASSGTRARRRRPGSPTARRRSSCRAPGSRPAPSAHAAAPATRCPSSLGAAHAPARILLGLAAPQTVLAAAGGLAEAVAGRAARRRGGAPRRGDGRARTLAGGGLGAARSSGPDMSPYVSGPRSWRERGQDFRLEGARCGSCGRLVFPAPPRCPHCGSGELAPRAARARRHRRHPDDATMRSRSPPRPAWRSSSSTGAHASTGRSCRRGPSRSGSGCGSCRAGCTSAATRCSTSGR